MKAKGVLNISSFVLGFILFVGPISGSSARAATEEEAKSDGVRTVYLIRHGDYDHEDDRDPDVGKALIPLGVAQARIVGARLRGMPVEFTSLHSSTMTAPSTLQAETRPIQERALQRRRLQL